MLLSPFLSITVFNTESTLITQVILITYYPRQVMSEARFQLELAAQIASLTMEVVPLFVALLSLFLLLIFVFIHHSHYFLLSPLLFSSMDSRSSSVTSVSSAIFSSSNTGINVALACKDYVRGFLREDCHVCSLLI